MTSMTPKMTCHVIAKIWHLSEIDKLNKIIISKLLILLIILLAALSSGCSESVSMNEINTAFDTCKNNGGLRRIITDGLLTESYDDIECEDGAFFDGTIIHAKLTTK